MRCVRAGFVAEIGENVRQREEKCDGEFVVPWYQRPGCGNEENCAAGEEGEEEYLNENFVGNLVSWVLRG